MSVGLEQTLQRFPSTEVSRLTYNASANSFGAWGCRGRLTLVAAERSRLYLLPKEHSGLYRRRDCSQPARCLIQHGPVKTVSSRRLELQFVYALTTEDLRPARGN